MMGTDNTLHFDDFDRKAVRWIACRNGASEFDPAGFAAT
jgi:hypothetical protein